MFVCRSATTPTYLSVRRHAPLSTCVSGPTSCPSSSTVMVSFTHTVRPRKSESFHTETFTGSCNLGKSNNRRSVRACANTVWIGLDLHSQWLCKHCENFPFFFSLTNLPPCGHKLIRVSQMAIIPIIDYRSCQIQVLLLSLTFFGVFFWCNLVFLSTSSSDYFKCCCLPSLRTTYSSRFFTGKVSTNRTLNTRIHKVLPWHVLTAEPQIHTSFCLPHFTFPLNVSKVSSVMSPRLWWQRLKRLR